jgi:hypothetical protein
MRSAAKMVLGLSELEIKGAVLVKTAQSHMVVGIARVELDRTLEVAHGRPTRQHICEVGLSYPACQQQEHYSPYTDQQRPCRFRFYGNLHTLRPT